MQITIKLEDPKSCKGCPLLNTKRTQIMRDKGISRQIFCIPCPAKRYSLKRPTKCIEENGE